MAYRDDKPAFRFFSATRVLLPFALCAFIACGIAKAAEPEQALPAAPCAQATPKQEGAPNWTSLNLLVYISPSIYERAIECHENAKCVEQYKKRPDKLEKLEDLYKELPEALHITALETLFLRELELKRLKFIPPSSDCKPAQIKILTIRTVAAAANEPGAMTYTLRVQIEDEDEPKVALLALSSFHKGATSRYNRSLNLGFVRLDLPNDAIAEKLKAFAEHSIGSMIVGTPGSP